MITDLQRNRIFQLIVGDYKTGEGVLIEDLQVSFDISKSSNNKDRTNSAAIAIYNLDPQTLALLDTDYPTTSFSVGYEDTGTFQQIFKGQVTNIVTRKSGTDVITQLQMGSKYTQLNHTLVSKLVAPGKSREDALQEFVTTLGAERGVFNIPEKQQALLYGYSMSGTPKESLDEFCSKYGYDWQIEDDVLYVHANDRANTENFQLAYVISEETGLVETAYRETAKVRKSKKDKAKKPGVVWKSLLNPDIKAGDIVKLEDTLIQGYFKVDKLKHFGGWRENTWYTECTGSAIEKVDKS